MINNEQLAVLNDKYNKMMLEQGFVPLVKNFYKKFNQEFDIAPLLKNIIQRIDVKKAVTKPELMQLCFSVFINEKIFKAFLSTVPINITRLIEKLLWVENMSEQDIQVLIKESITITEGIAPYSIRKNLKSEYLFFTGYKIGSSWNSDSNTIYFLNIDPVFKEILIPYYPKPVNYYFNPLNDIPVTKHRFSAEDTIMGEISRVLTYYMQGGIKYTSKGKPLDGTLPKLNRSCGIVEFLQGNESLSGKARTSLIAGMLFNFKLTDVSLDHAATIKELFTKQYFKLKTVQLILLQIKGWGYVNQYEYTTDVESTFTLLLKALPTDKWVSTTNFIEYTECRSIKLQPVSESAAANTLYYEKLTPRTANDYYFSPRVHIAGKMLSLITHPFIRGTIFLYAAFGLMEIAYDDVDTTEYPTTFNSAYDGLAYFKLTPLGAYVLGLTKEYAGSLKQQKNKLQLSEDSLTILAEGDMLVIDIMLANFAEKTGGNRYKVSPAHFLKNCQNATDIDKKITAFKRTIALPLPAYWAIQLATWQINVTKICELVSTLVFKIAADDKLLQKLIAQDPILKELILKAEQFHIMVKSGNVAKFKTRMKELSYLVE